MIMLNGDEHFTNFLKYLRKNMKTTKRLKRILQAFDIKIIDYPLETGLIAEIGHGEPCIASYRHRCFTRAS